MSVLCKYCLPNEEDEYTVFCTKLNKENKRYKCNSRDCKFHKFETQALVLIEVGRCDECPFVELIRTMGAGHAYDYYCKANKKFPKMIAYYVEYDSEIPPVPEWCPFKKKEEKDEIMD